MLSPTAASSASGQERRGRIGAHAAGVQAEVAVQGAFVVLGRREQLGGLAVAERVEGDFHALEQFLDDDAGARARQRPS